MSLLKIAAKIADQMILRTKAIVLSTNFTETDKLSNSDFEFELEREGLPIVSPSLQSLIDPDDNETFGGIPSHHTIEIGNIEYDSQNPDPSVGIMGSSVFVTNFDVIGIDGYTVNSEDAATLKNEIELTDKEEEQLSQNWQDNNSDYDF